VIANDVHPARCTDMDTFGHSVILGLRCSSFGFG
jgi:hypothetical protein